MEIYRKCLQVLVKAATTPVTIGRPPATCLQAGTANAAPAKHHVLFTGRRHRREEEAAAAACYDDRLSRIWDSQDELGGKKCTAMLLL